MKDTIGSVTGVERQGWNQITGRDGNKVTEGYNNCLYTPLEVDEGAIENIPTGIGYYNFLGLLPTDVPLDNHGIASKCHDLVRKALKIQAQAIATAIREGKVLKEVGK